MCKIHTYNGGGPFHFICVPGLVPDGPETFLRQIPVLRRFGRASVITYPNAHFVLDNVIDLIHTAVLNARAQGRLVVLIGVSVGAGICMELLRRVRADNHVLDLAAFIMVSPFSCTADLAPLLSRIVGGIESESDRGADGQPTQALERGRAFFRSLASKSIVKKPPTAGWRSLLAMMTPQGIADKSEARLRARIEHTLANISPQGGIDRVLALRQIVGLDTDTRATKPLTLAPTLILWGSKERHTLNMDGPGTRILCRPDLASRHFPDVEVQWVYANDGEEVPHASLLKHAGPFNRHMRHFLRRQSKTLGWFPRMTLLARAATPISILILAARGGG